MIIREEVGHTLLTLRLFFILFLIVSNFVSKDKERSHVRISFQMLLLTTKSKKKSLFFLMLKMASWYCITRKEDSWQLEQIDRPPTMSAVWMHYNRWKHLIKKRGAKLSQFVMPIVSLSLISILFLVFLGFYCRLINITNCYKKCE